MIGIATEIPDDLGKMPDYPTFAEHDRALAWKNCLGQLDSIRALRPNWDDAGAPAISSKLMEIAESLLTESRDLGGEAPSRVVPTPAGTIAVEWQSPDVYMEVEISEGGLECLSHYSDGTIEQATIEFSRAPYGIVEDEPAFLSFGEAVSGFTAAA